MSDLFCPLLFRFSLFFLPCMLFSANRYLASGNQGTAGHRDSQDKSDVHHRRLELFNKITSSLAPCYGLY